MDQWLPSHSPPLWWHPSKVTPIEPYQAHFLHSTCHWNVSILGVPQSLWHTACPPKITRKASECNMCACVHLLILNRLQVVIMMPRITCSLQTVHRDTWMMKRLLLRSRKASCFWKWVMMETWLVRCYQSPLWSRWPVEDPLVPVGRAQHLKLWTMHPSCRGRKALLIKGAVTRVASVLRTMTDYRWLQYSGRRSDGSMYCT